MSLRPILLWLPAAIFAAGYIILTAAGIYALFGMWMK
jgi:hypothetical protein